MIGVVKLYDARRGVGQITPENGDADIAVHASELERAGIARLNIGDRLGFDIQTDRALNRTFAVNLRLPEREHVTMTMPGHDLKAGWGVLRIKPWRLAGVFASSIEAETFMRTLGAGYVIRYGDHRVGSDDFTFEQTTG